MQEYAIEAARRNELNQAQMKHLIGVVTESKRETSEYQRESVLMRSELGQAEALIQSEHSSAQLLIQECAASCRSLDSANKQFMHLAQRANDAAPAHEFKDDELTRNALDTAKVIAWMNEQADLHNTELARKLQVAYNQCQYVVANATEAQSQAQAKIAMILEENQRDKDKMHNEMHEFASQGVADVRQ